MTKLIDSLYASDILPATGRGRERDQAVHPITKDFLSSVRRLWRPPEYEATSTATMVTSFRQRGLGPVVTVVALVEGFGPGWSAREVCQLAFQELRNQFVLAGDEDPGDVLHSALIAANLAVYERADRYQAVGEIGAEILVAVIARGRCILAQAGRGLAFLSRRGGDSERVAPLLLAGDGRFLGHDKELSLLSPKGTRLEAGVEDEKGGRLRSGDVIALMNAAMSAGLADDEISAALRLSPLERAADRLIESGQAQVAEAELLALLVEVPGAVQRAAASLPRFRRMLAFCAAALVLLSLLWWRTAPRREELFLPGLPDEVPARGTSTRLPTVTILLPPPQTGLPLLPTPVRTATPTRTPARTPIRRPPAGSAIPADVATGTSGPATQDETPTLSPIIVGHEVIIVGTGGLGVSVRADPGKGSDRLFIVLDGERLQVIGGPEEADGLQWWHLRAPSGEEGWGVERYLQGVAVP